MLKRVVSFVLSIAMMVSMVPVQTLAAEAAETEQVYAEETVVAEEPTEAETTAPVVTEETEEDTSSLTETAEETEGTVAPTETEAQVQEPTEAAPTEPTVEETIPELAQEAADAYSGTCGSDLTWTLSDEGVLNISGTGDMYDYYSYNDAPWYSYASSITSISLDVQLTRIGGSAFCDCTGLTSITIPNSVTRIGRDAFYGCSNLTSITIGNGVTSIGSYAFGECDSLTSVYIPESLTGTGSDIFYACNSSLQIYCGAESEPSGWSFLWNRYDDSYGDNYYLRTYWNCTR